MILGIAADLSAPPSDHTCFRDLSLFATVFRHYEVVAYADRDEWDSYSVWFRRYGLFDFVEDIVTREELGNLPVEIEGGKAAKLTAHNLHLVIALL